MGVDDLEELDEACVLRLLSKEELDGAIKLEELHTIMANFGLYDEDE